MAIDKAPAYQMYARDWLGSRNVRLMQDFQRGWYIQLLNEAWDNDPQGMLPNDPEMLMQLAGVTEARKNEPAFNQCWTAVMARFEVDGAWVFNAKQLAQVADQIAYRERQSRAGTASAKAKAERKAEVARLLQNANAGSTTVQPPLNGGSIPVATETQPDLNSPPAPAPAPPSASAKEKTTRPRADAVLYRWDEFAAIYPPYRVYPDKAAKAWWAKNAKTDDVVDRILESVRGWLKSIQWEDGVIPNCSKFLDEGIWKGAPGPGKAEAKGWFD